MAEVRHGKFIRKDYGKIIESEQFKRDRRITAKLRRETAVFDAEMKASRLDWDVSIKTPMRNVILEREYLGLPAGYVLQVPHDIGRYLLHKRRAAIIESDNITVDFILEGELEDLTVPLENVDMDLFT